MKNFILGVLLFFQFPLDISGQVFTRIIGDEKLVSDYMPWYFEDSPQSYSAPDVDTEYFLRQDELSSRTQPRLAIKQELSINKTNGTLYKGGNYWVWKLKLHASDAKSLSLHFENLNLPVGSSGYIYNKETKYLIGPFSREHIYDGKFNSDYLNGDELILDIFITEDKIEEFEIEISSMNYGIKALEAGIVDSDFGSSGNCNVNVRCPEGQGWESQSNSVCKIIHSTIGSCSGALINNECNDLTPNILTAEHCVKEARLDEYIFRFKYESYVCEHNGNNDGVEPNQNLWVTYSGAIFRSSWALPNTDFALIELMSSNVSGLSFSGWDRSDSPGIGTPTVIHHPSGDVKKISIDNESATDDDEFTWFVDDWDIGTTEGGSSGSPLYGDLGLIVGIDSRGDGFSACEPEKGTFFGKFSRSWDGGGTNETSLAPWLGIANNPMVLDGIDEIPKIKGPSVICESPRKYTLVNIPSGYNVSWNATPANLLSTSPNGIGSIAILAGKENVSGEVILTYTLTNNDCGNLVFTKAICIGKPAIPEVEIPDCFPIGSNVALNVQSEGATTYSWTFPSCPSGSDPEVPNSDCWFNYSGDGPNDQIFAYVGEQVGSISVWATNECGTSSRSFPIILCDDDGGPKDGPIIIRTELLSNELSVKIYPNPTTNFVNIESSEVYSSLHLYNTQGELVMQKHGETSSTIIDVTDFPIGIYFVILQSSLNREIYKIVRQ